MFVEWHLKLRLVHYNFIETTTKPIYTIDAHYRVHTIDDTLLFELQPLTKCCLDIFIIEQMYSIENGSIGLQLSLNLSCVIISRYKERKLGFNISLNKVMDNGQ